MITVNMSAKYKEVMTQVGAVRKALRCSVSEVRVLFSFGFEKKTRDSVWNEFGLVRFEK